MNKPTRYFTVYTMQSRQDEISGLVENKKVDWVRVFEISVLSAWFLALSILVAFFQ